MTRRKQKVVRWRKAILQTVLLAAAFQPAVAAGATRVLFVGNSFTYYNNVPAMLEALGRDAGFEIATRMIVFGGATLQGHWDAGEAPRSIREGHWDYVVLQEQSSLGVPFLVNGIPRITDSAKFHAAARLFDGEIKKAGARTVFLLTWSAKTAPDEQAALDYAHMTIAKELGAMVAPVGDAWRKAGEERPKLDLYFADGSHPGPAGSYLAASVLYATLLGKSPAGLVRKIQGTPIDDTGQPQAGTIATLVDLPRGTAEFLQRLAWQTFEELRAAGGYFEAAKPPPPKLPEFAPGRPFTAADIEGRWKGDLKLYFFPAAMELRLQRQGDQLAPSLVIKFRGGGPGGGRRIAGFEANGAEIQFKDTSERSSETRFRGVFTGDRLAGIAEIVRKDQRPIAVGSWELRRRK